MRIARQVTGVFAVALSGVLLLPALFLATYDHEGGSPLGNGQFLQLVVVATGFALALWGHHTHRMTATLLSFVFAIGWVPLVVAMAE